MLILASASPRRRELLGRVVKDFIVRPADTDETVAPGTDWEKAVRMIAVRKAFAAADFSEDAWILSADTIVVLENRILGKPSGREQARQMLCALSGKTHQVATAYCLLHPLRGEMYLGMEVTRVHFQRLDAQDMEYYLQTDEPYDKAGAYGAQGLAAPFIRGMEGDYTNVVGLPLPALYPILKRCGLADVCMSEV